MLANLVSLAWVHIRVLFPHFLLILSPVSGCCCWFSFNWRLVSVPDFNHFDNIWWILPLTKETLHFYWFFTRFYSIYRSLRCIRIGVLYVRLVPPLTRFIGSSFLLFYLCKCWQLTASIHTSICSITNRWSILSADFSTISFRERALPPHVFWCVRVPNAKIRIAPTNIHHVV